jgi:arylsulfatase A-like enzyme
MKHRLEQMAICTDLILKKSVEVISRSHQKPFFLNIMFNAPHWPWQGPNDKPLHDTTPWVAGGSAEIYAAMMVSLDNAVGTILKTLEDHDLAKNTVVIFTSDNGGERFSDMGIFKGKKMQLWEGGIRVPAFIRWPGFINQTVLPQVATTMDWTQTILSIAGAKEKAEAPLDGIDLLPVVTGNQKEIERDLYWRIYQRVKHKAMRSGKWKFLQDEKGEEYLFDLEKDPSEKDNLRETEATIFAGLKNKYAQWETTVLKPVSL